MERLERVIEAYELSERLVSSKPPLVINVLSAQEYEDCHIALSINIPLIDLEKEVAALDKKKEIVLYCAHEKCPASKKAYEKMAALGFTNLWVYEGGMRDWKSKNLECSGGCDQSYLV